MGVSDRNSNQPHTRNLALANATPRCGAKTRHGQPCKAPAVTGKRRCRMHGGATGSGAPTGERNGRYRYGRFTNEAKAQWREIRQLINTIRQYENMEP
jgi:hypothetical protein